MARGSYRHGRIVWAYLRSSTTGKRQRHPAIILDRDEEIIQPEHFDPRQQSTPNFVHVIGVSTKHKLHKMPYVTLPFAARGHPVTKLNQECGAVIGWYHRIEIPDDVLGFGGDVPSAEMAMIDAAVRKDLRAKLGMQFDRIRQLLDQWLSDG